MYEYIPNKFHNLTVQWNLTTKNNAFYDNAEFLLYPPEYIQNKDYRVDLYLNSFYPG